MYKRIGFVWATLLLTLGMVHCGDSNPQCESIKAFANINTQACQMCRQTRCAQEQMNMSNPTLVSRCGAQWYAAQNDCPASGTTSPTLDCACVNRTLVGNDCRSAFDQANGCMAANCATECR